MTCILCKFFISYEARDPDLQNKLEVIIMKTEDGVRLIGGFLTEVWHDGIYTSDPGRPDLRQDLYERKDGSFYLLQKWPYDFSGGRETISEVSVWELPMVLSGLEGPIGDRARALEIEDISVCHFGVGLTLDETAKRLNVSPATVKRRLPIIKAVLRGNLSVLSGEHP